MQVVIEYRAVVPGQRHFQCSPLRALLSSQACADRFSRTLQPDSEKFITCKRCPIGRQHYEEHHTGESTAPLQPVRASVCVRCGRPASRMVGNEICPSCFNRFREFLKGRNGRGSAPVNYRPPVPRRVGVLGADDAPAWALFDGQHHQEAMARATRAGLRLSPAQPGRTHWNTERQAFEYHDEAGRVLIELEIDGRVEYVGVEQLHRGEQPAAVTMQTQLLTPDEAALWLEISGEGDELGVDWRQTSFACGKCGQGMVHAYRSLAGVKTRCSAGCC